MTKQEAIDVICEMATDLQIPFESKQGVALLMAIEALKGENNGTHNDYSKFYSGVRISDSFRNDSCFGKKNEEV